MGGPKRRLWERPVTDKIVSRRGKSFSRKILGASLMLPRKRCQPQADAQFGAGPEYGGPE